MNATCPNGHASEEPDYCSVCGAAMSPPSPPPSSAPTPSTEPACPSCGAPRSDPDSRYCEVCRYDFQARIPGPPPIVEPAAAAPPVSARAEWEVTIVVDPSLDVDPEPGTSPPVDLGERIFPIDLPDMLIGRRDDRHDIRPHIPIVDPAVSRRHARLLRQPNGGLAILDLASANGTVVNGTEIAAGEKRDLADGDTVTMGRWTRLGVRRR